MTTKETWKPVTIGGLTGILMGAGAMYGVQAVASGSEDVTSGADEGLKVATVNDAMSFNHAFEAARAQVGAGGVFTWRGHIFNTYTEAEWNTLSAADRHHLAEQVKPEIPAVDVDAQQVAGAPATDDDVQVAQRVAQPQDHDVEVQSGRVSEGNDTEAQWNSLGQEENDVRIVGFNEYDLGNGHSIAMQTLSVNGQRVAIVDLDEDGEPDIAMTDLNHNHQMDEGEVIDLQTGEALSFTNDDTVADNVPDLDFNV